MERLWDCLDDDEHAQLVALLQAVARYREPIST
jgi:hypothetical protein